jgi:hypothetical protein
MDGYYLNNNVRQYLCEWIDKIIKNKSWERYEDLHLDEIDNQFKHHESWVRGGISVYELILSIVFGKPYNCFLVIQLSYSNNKTNVNDLKWDQLTSLLDITPPSFYVFPEGNINYEKTITDLLYVESLSKEIGYKVFLKEEKEGEGEYFRCLYIGQFL